jgi:hypothetical protein
VLLFAGVAAVVVLELSLLVLLLAALSAGLAVLVVLLVVDSVLGALLPLDE